MKMGKYLLAALLVVGFAATVHAAPVGLTSEADATEGELWADNNLALSVGILYDSIGERNVEVDDGDFEMQALMARIGLSVLDRFTFYVDIGQATETELSYKVKGENHTIAYDDETILGVGLSALIHRWDNGIEVGANVSYRQIDLELEKVTIDGVEYSATPDLTSISSSDFEEVQAALELAWRTDNFIPYVGIKFSDVELGSDYTLAPQQYSESKGRNADKNVGVFVGLTITPKMESMEKAEQISINIEGRLLDEEAISIGASYKF